MHVHMGDIIYIHVNTVTLSIDLQAVFMTGYAAMHLQRQGKGITAHKHGCKRSWNSWLCKFYEERHAFIMFGRPQAYRTLNAIIMFVYKKTCNQDKKLFTKTPHWLKSWIKTVILAKSMRDKCCTSTVGHLHTVLLCSWKHPLSYEGSAAGHIYISELKL